MVCSARGGPWCDNCEVSQKYSVYPNWLNSHIGKEILREQFLKIGFSQNGEDEFIRGFFWDQILHKRTSQYLDIGCFDETLYSNTKLLSLCGWTGIAVDANPDTEVKWKSRRVFDFFYNVAVRDSSCDDLDLEFYRFNDGAINTIQKEVAKDWVKRGFPFKDVICVKCLGIDEIASLIKRDHPEFSPQLVNIDIEQVNYLPSFGRFLEILDRPKLLCVEWVSQGFGLNNFKESEEFEILEKSGYEVVALVGGNIMAARPD